MVDETTDKSNKEQLTLVLRWISEDFLVSEEFVGLYYLSAIDTQSIVEVMKDTFIRFQIPLTKMPSQMQTFKFLVGISLSELILRHTVRLCRCLNFQVLKDKV